MTFEAIRGGLCFAVTDIGTRKGWFAVTKPICLARRQLQIEALVKTAIRSSISRPKCLPIVQIILNLTSWTRLFARIPCHRCQFVHHINPLLSRSDAKFSVFLNGYLHLNPPVINFHCSIIPPVSFWNFSFFFLFTFLNPNWINM